MINRYGELIILCNDDIEGGNIFRRDVTSSQGHTYYIQEFSNKYNLGFNFKESDYNTAPCEIAMLGHLVIKTIEDVKMLVCYLPEVITDTQYEFIYKNQEILTNNIQNDGYSLRNNEFVKINGFDNLMREINRKNLLYDKERQVKGV